jgi:hypothetical protein
MAKRRSPDAKLAEAMATGRSTKASARLIAPLVPLRAVEERERELDILSCTPVGRLAPSRRKHPR